MTSLGIVVPYRDRAAHLDMFIPHMMTFFQNPLNDWATRVIIKIVEQTSELEFNRGALKNIGFVLSRDLTAATAFHDVDYLPTNADYRPPEGWAPLVKGGFELAYNGGLVVPMPKEFFGGAVLFQNSALEKVNGYSNSYWGYGSEDADLAMRTSIGDIPYERRSGQFLLLSHEHHGFSVSPSGEVARSEAMVRNAALFDRRFPDGTTNEQRRLSSGYATDGLSSLKFEIVRRRKLVGIPAPSKFDIEMVTVSLSPSVVS